MPEPLQGFAAHAEGSAQPHLRSRCNCGGAHHSWPCGMAGRRLKDLLLPEMWFPLNNVDLITSMDPTSNKSK